MTSPGTALGTRPSPIMIAPMPTTTGHMLGLEALSAARSMPYACQSCVRRKVKCDRTVSVCSSCSKSKLDCVYRAPPLPRPRRRKRSGSDEEDGDEEDDIRARLVRYERLLQQNGLLPESVNRPPPKASQLHPVRNSTIPTISETATGQPEQPGKVRTGKLLSRNGKSRYINSSIWLDAGEVDMRELADHEHDHDGEEGFQSISKGLSPLTQDPVSAALLCAFQDQTIYHPSHRDAKKLWTAYTANVEPLCKVLHTPTTTTMLETVSRQPATASREQDCLLFSVYHSAVLSMADEECLLDFGQSRSSLLIMYQRAVLQSLANASWLKTTDMSVMQAYVLFLIVMRTQIDPHTFWILTGVAVRIAQRMGLHRDSEGLGLSPFDVEMRRRLFWQLIPLDALAGQVSGSGITMAPSTWDTKKPLNINDDQIYPGMTEQPEEETGASEMIFCLARAELSDLFTRTGVQTNDFSPSVDLRKSEELDRLIDEVEGVIEAKYLRYCDIGNRLHFLALGIVRSAANTVRLHNRLSSFSNQTIGDGELKDLCTLAHKILETDNAMYRNPSTKGFHWQIKSSFLWDAVKCILTSLARPGFRSRTELDATWSKMADFYSNHLEVIEVKGAIQALVGKATLQAWRANPPTLSTDEPSFITMLRANNSKIQASRRQKQRTSEINPSNEEGAAATSSFEEGFGTFDGADMTFDSDFNANIAGWMFWDQAAQSLGLDFR